MKLGLTITNSFDNYYFYFTYNQSYVGASLKESLQISSSEFDKKRRFGMPHPTEKIYYAYKTFKRRMKLL